MTVRHFVIGSRPFEVKRCLPNVGSRNFRRLKIKALPSFKMSETNYLVVHRHVAEERVHQPHSCENLKPNLQAGTGTSGDVHCGIASRNVRYYICRLVACDAVISKVC
jgi:hypothetical protein